ncbi:hypothetical protein V8E54_010709 [Elaphomyces granulatus]
MEPVYVSQSADCRQATDDLLKNWFHTSGQGREFSLFVIVGPEVKNGEMLIYLWMEGHGELGIFQKTRALLLPRLRARPAARRLNYYGNTFLIRELKSKESNHKALYKDWKWLIAQSGFGIHPKTRVHRKSCKWHRYNALEFMDMLDELYCDSSATGERAIMTVIRVLDTSNIDSTLATSLRFDTYPYYSV